MTRTPFAPTRRGLLLGAAATAVASPWVARAQSYKSEYKLTVVGNRPIPFAEGAFKWAELVTERSQGRINVKVYPGSQLVGGDQTRELVALRQGVADFGVFSSINIAPQVKEWSLFQLPFLTPNHKAFDAVLASPVGQKLWATLESRDVIPLAWGENGFRELSNSKRAVRKPDDLRGLKIRFAAGAIFNDIYTGMGANPVQMSFADLQPALTTGAVDGQENPINLFLAFKMDTLAQKHLTVWNYVNDPITFNVAKGVWGTFSKADQDLIREAAVEAGKLQMGLARKGLGAGGDNSAFDELKARGVAVEILTPEEKQAFAAATRPVFTKWAATVGNDLVAEAEKIIAASA
jgi:tripartite ATP-independent transporter DctP family solute receptor